MYDEWEFDHVHQMIQRVSGTICLFLLAKMFISTWARLYGYTYVSLDTTVYQGSWWMQRWSASIRVSL
ncbi:hypothetical protein ABH908_003203 [Pseudomonas frederiksbergensis]